ncbi:MAG TPA: peptidoglycan DD-metalloendopeptidase family protein [Marmoricola sp.]|nr:peptidoglycan DD-metalloendopeptidase family protein [Marmoricola sp.]
MAASVAVLLAASAIALPNASADDLKHRKHQVHRHVRHAQAQFDESSGALRRATARLDSAQARLGAAQRHLADTRGKLAAARILDAQMQDKLDQARQELAGARQDVADSRADIGDKKADIGRIAVQSYQGGSPSLMGITAMLNAQQPTDVITQLNTVGNLMNRESNALDRLEAAKALLVVRERQVEKAKQKVAAQRAAAAANLVRRRQLEAEAENERAQVAQLVAARRDAARQARQARAHDLAVLRKAKQRERKIQQRILARARRAAQRHGGYHGSNNGFLYRPLPGYITSPFGWREHPIYHYWGLHDGVDMASPCGTPERAAGTGRVVSEYYSSVWGHRLFLDLGQVNGKNMTVIYNHIARYRVGTGAHVRRGEVLAYEGTTGWSTGCHLHFTVMLNGNPVNPERFF